jgi:hypothetical protein
MALLAKAANSFFGRLGTKMDKTGGRGAHGERAAAIERWRPAVR